MSTRWVALLYAVAWSVSSAQSDGLKVTVTEHGSGPLPKDGQVVVLHYVGTLADGKQFDSSRERGRPFAFTLGAHQVIKGFDEGFRQLHVGDKATLIIPSELAYGEKGAGGVIPPNATLQFDVELLKLEDHALADALDQSYQSGGLPEAERQFSALRGQHFKGYFVDEGGLNNLGYRYLKKGRATAAVAAFRWATTVYPKSAEAWDSLAEGYNGTGEEPLSRGACKHAVALDPKILKSKDSWCATRK